MKWLSWTNVFFGSWSIAAPFVLGYSSTRDARIEDVLMGTIIASFALWRAMGPETAGMRAGSWIVAAAGLWGRLIGSLVLGYRAVYAAVANDSHRGCARVDGRRDQRYRAGTHG